MHLDVVLEDRGLVLKFRILTPRSWLYNMSKTRHNTRARWQIDYVKYIIAKILWAYLQVRPCENFKVVIDHDVISTLLRKMVEALEQTNRYRTRHGQVRYLEITSSHIKRAIREARGEIDREGIEKFIDKYLKDVETDFTIQIGMS